MNPERCFKYTVPVTAVAFSNENSQLLAIGFYDGSIRIVDITIADACNLVAISDRKTSPPIEPIWQMKWIKCKRIYIKLTFYQWMLNLLTYLISWYFLFSIFCRHFGGSNGIDSSEFGRGASDHFTGWFCDVVHNNEQYISNWLSSNADFLKRSRSLATPSK